MDDLHKKLVEQANLIIKRLEKVSVDSIWSRRSSGLRGNLLKLLEEIENNPSLSESQVNRLENLCKVGFTMLENAAREKQRSRPGGRSSH